MAVPDATLTSLSGTEFITVQRPHTTFRMALATALQAPYNVAPQLTGATPNIDWSLAGVFNILLSANATITFSNAADGREIKVYITNTASNYTVTWPGGIKWAGGSAPTQTTGAKTDIVTLRQYGGVIYGSTSQNY